MKNENRVLVTITYISIIFAVTTISIFSYINSTIWYNLLNVTELLWVENIKWETCLKLYESYIFFNYLTCVIITFLTLNPFFFVFFILFFSCWNKNIYDSFSTLYFEKNTIFLFCKTFLTWNFSMKMLLKHEFPLWF